MKPARAFSSSTSGGLAGFYDEELSALLHINFPQVFLRRTKNAFLSIVSARLLDTVTGEPPVSRDALACFL